jgi:hypothetical protein
MEPRLLFFFVCGDGLQVFGFKNLSAIQALDVVHAIASSNHLGTGMVTSGLHNSA